MVLVICLWFLCVCRFLPCLQYGRERYWLHFKEVRESMITETFMGSCTCVRVYLPQSFSPLVFLSHTAAAPLTAAQKQECAESLELLYG